MKRDEAVEYIRTHNLIGIKAGEERTSFLDIWMVVVDDRIFARSWGLAERSWYNTFLQNPNGQIKCDSTILSAKAFALMENDIITEKINNAYLTKYNSKSSIKYAKGITKGKHIEKTMELIIMEE